MSYTSNYQQEPLPYGWEMLIDQGTGWHFFVDHVNKKTSWKDPRLDIYERQRGRSQTTPGHGSYLSDGAQQIPIQRGGNYEQQQTHYPYPRSQQQQWYPQQQQQNNSYPQYGAMPQPDGRMPGYPMSTHHQNMPQQNQPMPGYPDQRMPAYPESHRPVYPDPSQRPVYPDPSQRPGYPEMPSYQMPKQSSRMPGPFPTGPLEGDTVRARMTTPETSSSCRSNHFSSGENVIKSEPKTIPVIREHKAAAAASERPRSAEISSKTRTDQLHTDANDKKCASAASSPQVLRKAKYQSLSPEEASLEKIRDVDSDVSEILKEVNSFDGKTKDKHYKYLEEILTKNMLSLDDVEAYGQNEIRQARKNCIKMVQSALDQLELKAFSNETGGESSTDTSSDTVKAACSPTEDVVKRTEKQLNILGNDESEKLSQPMARGGERSGGQSTSGSRSTGQPGGRVKEMTLNSEVNC